MANKGNRAGEGPAKKKGGLLRRMGTLALVLCAVLAVVVLTTMEAVSYTHLTLPTNSRV